MMARVLRGARLDRWIERELTCGLSPRKRSRLHAQLREDAEARARYDRAVAAVRVFEGDVEFAPSELDLVQRWLVDEWGGAATAEPTPARRWWPAVAAALMAAVVLLWAGSLGTSGGLAPWTTTDDGWGVRGPGHSDGLALEALCGPDDPDPVGIEVRARECGTHDLLGFAYRTLRTAPGQLTLFGIDAQGDPMFYAPTPVDAAAVTVEPGMWRASSLAVRLSVNHAAGPLRIYGVVAPVAATPDEVRGWVEQLSVQAEAAPGDRPWTERVSASSLSRLCAASADCQAAELRLIVRP